MHRMRVVSSGRLFTHLFAPLLLLAAMDHLHLGRRRFASGRGRSELLPICALFCSSSKGCAALCPVWGGHHARLLVLLDVLESAVDLAEVGALDEVDHGPLLLQLLQLLVHPLLGGRVPQHLARQLRMP